MSKIRKDIIDKILETAKIEEVIQECLGSYSSDNKAGLKKCGVRYEALCPFHTDKSLGSFVVYPKGNCYKCFSCGAKGGVIDFLMEHEKLTYPDAIRWLGKKYNIPVDEVPVNWKYVPKPAPPPLPTLELPKYLMAGTKLSLDKDNLVTWIRTGIKWDVVQRSRIDQVINQYNVGHGKYGHTIFWQLDEKGNLRTAKMMKYRTDGHRDKHAQWNFDFVHSIFARGQKQFDERGQLVVDEHGEPILKYPYKHIYDEEKQEARLTFFGMHLLDKYGKNATVNIVESEKTAILMAIAYGNHAQQVWMACGGLEMITRERLQPIIDRGRRIVLYPDRDGIDKWRIKCEQMHYPNMAVECIPVQKWWKPEDGEKADIADVVIRIINNSKELKTIDQVRSEMPQANGLIDKLNLEIEDNEQERHSTE